MLVRFPQKVCQDLRRREKERKAEGNLFGTETGLIHWRVIVIAGFFTGGALAIRGGMKAARNSAIGCGILLAVIEGVGIGIQRMMAENTRLDVHPSVSSRALPLPAIQTILTNSSLV